MSNITSVLGNEPGIQYDRPNDKTGGAGAAPINNVIVGSFKRGRTDRLMDITKRNLRARLGFDPKNPFYVAVQDALDTNIPSVKVLRIVTNDEDGGEGGNPPVVGISCVGATNTFKLTLVYETTNSENLIYSAMNAFSFIANGQGYELIPSFIERNIELIADQINPELYIRAEVTYKNTSNQNAQLKLIKRPEGMMLNQSLSNTNPTLSRNEAGDFTVCVSPEIQLPEIPELGDIDDSNTNDGWGYVNINTDSILGQTNPTFAKTSSLTGPVVITTGASFVGQTISQLDEAFTLNPDTPIVGQSLQFANTPAFIPVVQMDGEVLGLGGGFGSGWSSPVSVLFDKDVSAVVITGGVFNNINSTYIKCFDRMGNVIGVASNKALEIDDYGFSSGEQAKIAGFSFYINSLEGAGFGLRTIKFL